MTFERLKDINRNALNAAPHFDYNGSIRKALEPSSNKDSALSIAWEPTKIDASPIPLITLDGQTFSLNSRYDPIREAHRIAAELDKGELTIILGFEAGYLCNALSHNFTDASSFKRILCIEFIPELLIETFEKRDMRLLIEDKRFYVACLKTELELRTLISQVYQVHYFSSVRVFCSTAMLKLYKNLNLNVEPWLNSAVREMQSDFLTQAHLGRRWMYNIITNVSMIPRLSIEHMPKTIESIVLGAGPSAENQSKKIRALMDNGAVLFASDASLSWCQRHNITPDILLSIDGQSISYIHLLESRTGYQGTPLLQIADLCSHPSFLRNGSNCLLVGSRHPFVQMLRYHGLQCDELDTAGGNVGQSLMSIALSAGSQVVHAFGLDFAYPLGKPYMRPSFFYSAVLTNSSRLHTLEHGTSKLWLDHELSPVPNAPSYYRTQRMKWYAEKFEKLVETSTVTIISYSETWEGHVSAKGTSQFPAFSGTDKHAYFDQNIDISDVMKKINVQLEGLLKLDTDPLELRDQADSPEQKAMFALLPLIAWHTAFILKTDPESTDNGKRALQRAARDARDLISHFF